MQPDYEPSKRRLTWRNGCTAYAFSADEPDRLRGPQHTHAWADELAAWSYPVAAWNQLQLGLRLGPRPRCVVTTTPRPIKLLKELLARVGQDVALSRGSTFENAANLPANFLAQIKDRYEGTRLSAIAEDWASRICTSFARTRRPIARTMQGCRSSAYPTKCYWTISSGDAVAREGHLRHMTHLRNA
jgi:phage terminase large subunit-like protein